MDGETYKIDWIADISIETDYIVGLHDGCDCRHVGKGAEWLFEFWFGSEILTANIDFAPYAKHDWVVDKINSAAAIINMQTDEKINEIGSLLLPRIVKNETDIASLVRRVGVNEGDISALKREDTNIWNAINAIKNGDTISIENLIKEDARINKRIDDLAEKVDNYHNSYISRFGGIENRVLAIENYIANWNPGDGDGGDTPPVIIPPVVSGDYISKVIDDYANGVITFNKGIRIGDGTDSVLIDYNGGAVRINGNAFTTGWLSACGKPNLSGGDSGGSTGGGSDNPGGGTGDGGNNPSVPVDLSEYIKRTDADNRYIRKDQADSTSFPVTFKDGIVLANGDKSVRLELDQDGYVKVNGNAYATGWISACGKPSFSEGDSGSNNGLNEDDLWRMLGRSDADKKIHGSHIMVDGVTIKMSSTGVLYSVSVTSDGEEDTTDLSNYYTKSEIDDILSESYYTYQEVNDLLEDYYTKSEIDDELEGYYPVQTDGKGNRLSNATEEWVQTYTAGLINNAGYIDEDELNNYLADYCTLDNLNTKLEDYYTKSEAESMFIRKDQDDEDNFIVDFKNGIKINGILIDAVDSNVVRVHGSLNATGEVSALA